jgi:hypothetical protein
MFAQMDTPPSDPATPRATGSDRGAAPGGTIFGHRRSFLVNARYQLRASLLTATVVLVLLVFLNLVLFATTMSRAEKILVDAPELAAVIKAQDRVELSLIILASFVYLAGVVLVTVLETHRTAGAAYNLERRLGEIQCGHYNARLNLRKGDNLREIEEAFNAMSSTLENRTWDEIEALNQLALDAEKVRDHAGACQIAARMREMAEEKRGLVR